MLSKFADPHSPGCAVLVVKGGRVAYRRGYGAAEMRTGRAIGPETNFRLASLSKQFTATAVMMLVADGKLRYDEHITNYADLVDAARKISEGRERIEQQTREFDHRTATVGVRGVADDKEKPIN